MDGARKERRGFASMSREKQREIASKGGRAAHEKGTAHEWTPDEARAAGRKGGQSSRGGVVDSSDSCCGLAQHACSAAGHGSSHGLTFSPRGQDLAVRRARFPPVGPSHVDAGVVKTRPAAQIGQRVGGQGIRGVAVGCVLSPQPLGQHHGPWPNPCANLEAASHFPQCIDDADLVTVAQSTDLGILGMHEESDLGPRKLTERRTDRALAAGEISARELLSSPGPADSRTVACGRVASKYSGNRSTLRSAVRGTRRRIESAGLRRSDRCAAFAELVSGRARMRAITCSISSSARSDRPARQIEPVQHLPKTSALAAPRQRPRSPACPVAG